MIITYCEQALSLAKYKKLDDETWFAEIPDFEGVWGNGVTIEECRKDLLEVLEEWLIFKLQDGDSLPIINGIEIKVNELVEI